MKKSSIVTIVIICLIVFFAILIVLNFIPEQTVNSSNASSANEAPPAQGRGGERGEASGERGGNRSEGNRGERSETAGGREGNRSERSEGANTRSERNDAAGASSGGRSGGGTSRVATTVRVMPVAPGTIERSVIINGEILARNQVTIYPTVGGRLVDVRLRVGDRVSRGAVVATIDPSRPGEVYSHSPVISTVSGTVLQVPYSIGATLTTQSPVYVVGDLSSLIIETHIAERYSAVITRGMRASLWLEALPGEIFTAEVFEIDPVLDSASRTLRIGLRFVTPDPRIRAGMFATISLVTNRRVDVPVIPKFSTISTYGSWIVFVVNEEDNIARRREVTLGIENEEFVEILSGLEFGEIVVTAGQNFLSDGDLVRIVE